MDPLLDLVRRQFGELRSESRGDLFERELLASAAAELRVATGRLGCAMAVTSVRRADVVDGAFVLIGHGFGPPDSDLGQVRVEKP
jgi:hypothetical protein